MKPDDSDPYMKGAYFPEYTVLRVHLIVVSMGLIAVWIPCGINDAFTICLQVHSSQGRLQ